MPRYKCKNIAALDIALSGLPAIKCCIGHERSLADAATLSRGLARQKVPGVVITAGQNHWIYHHAALCVPPWCISLSGFSLS